MARQKSTDPESEKVAAAKKATARKISALREAMKLPRTTLSVMLQMGSALLTAKESGRIAFAPKELIRIETELRDHLATSLAAFETTFGHPAFSASELDLDAYTPRRMKLSKPISSSHRIDLIQTSTDLEELIAALEQDADNWAKLQEAKEDAEAQIAHIRELGGHSREHAEELNTLSTQIELIGPSIRETAVRVERNRQIGTRMVPRAAELIRQVASPLLDQLKADVETALSPFFADAAGRANQLIADMDARNALVSFLQRGQFVSHTTSAERVIDLAKELLATIKTIREGGEIFTFKPLGRAA